MPFPRGDLSAKGVVCSSLGFECLLCEIRVFSLALGKGEPPIRDPGTRKVKGVRAPSPEGQRVVEKEREKREKARDKLARNALKREGGGERT